MIDHFKKVILKSAEKRALLEFLTGRSKEQDFGGEDRNTPLHLVIKYDLLEFLDPLIQGGADLNARNAAGKTPIDIASKKRDLDTVRFLVERGARVYSSLLENSILKADQQMTAFF